MPDKEIAKQVAVVIRIDDRYHRAFELKEQGDRHIMLWKNCPLHDGPEQVFAEAVFDGLPTFYKTDELCIVCFEDELGALN